MQKDQCVHDLDWRRVCLSASLTVVTSIAASVFVAEGVRNQDHFCPTIFPTAGKSQHIQIQGIERRLHIELGKSKRSERDMLAKVAQAPFAIDHQNFF